MMRYPDFLRDNGTIGFVAPSFGCVGDPYESAFNNALETFEKWVTRRCLAQIAERLRALA